MSVPAALRSFFTIIVVCVFVLPATTRAQSFDLTNIDPFTVSVTPQNPVPYGQATLSLLSSSLNLANATLTVSVAGKQIYSGGVEAVSIPVGGAGALINVLVSISSNGKKYSKTVAIRPQDVVLISEPISSAPILYRGKPLIPLEGTVRVVAIASVKDGNGKTFDPNLLSYNWSVDDVEIANASGIGKEAIIVASPLQYRNRSVSVMVQSQDGNFVSNASVSFTASEPTVRVYENDPLLGILYDHAFSGTYTIAGTESSLYGAPFSFPTNTGNPVLQWFLNSSLAQTGNAITLRPSGSGQGSASLSFVGASSDFIKATQNLSLSFGAKSGRNLFGL